MNDNCTCGLNCDKILDQQPVTQSQDIDKPVTQSQDISCDDNVASPHPNPSTEKVCDVCVESPCGVTHEVCIDNPVAEPQNIDQQEQPVAKPQDKPVSETQDKPSTEEVCANDACADDACTDFVPIPLSLDDMQKYNAILANKNTLVLIYNNLLESCDKYHLNFIEFYDHLKIDYKLPPDLKFEIVDNCISQQIEQAGNASEPSDNA